MQPRTIQNDKINSESGGTYEKSVGKITDLPTIPHVLMSIWKLLDDPDSSSADLEKVISLDQALTAKVIRLANSPFYHTKSEVSSVRSAIVNVGFDAVKNLVIAVSITSVFKKLKGANRYFPLKEFWRHCVGVGVVSRSLAKKVEGIDSETCFCAGILHDVGKFVMNLLFPKEFADALALAAKEKIYIHEAEGRLFDVDHSFFGERLAEHWKFSAELAGIIRNHHRPIDEIPDLYMAETAIIQVADSITRDLQFGFPGDFIKGAPSELALEFLRVDDGFTGNFSNEVVGEIQSAGEILNLV